MELWLFILGLGVSIGLSFMAYNDRLYGVAGILLGLVTMGYAGSDGVITTAIGFNGASTVTNTISVYPFPILFAGVIIVIDFVTLYGANNQYQSLHRVSDEDAPY